MRITPIFLLLSLSACGTKSEPTVVQIEPLFKTPFPNTNGRSCATCHVPEHHFTLPPEYVARLWETNPNDPLFAAIDADDPTAEILTFEHLKKGLVRVWLTLPANMDLIDDMGAVITPIDRKIFVWRGVPSIAGVASTAPYQLDGRERTLESQAQGAVTSHSEGGTVGAPELARIAAFERTIVLPASAQELSAEERRGREVYEQICAPCHGGENKATIVDRTIHDLAFPALRADGTVVYRVPATDPPAAVLADQADNEFLNIGTAMENHLVQLGATEHESFTKDLGFPAYRFRFYRDASRAEVTAELPPALAPEDPLTPSTDADGNPLIGPNFFFQLFTPDPGRAAITGSPYDFEAFDIPTLRGIANTAPYWHNHISETLEEVVDLYSDHLLAKFPTLSLPGEKEPDPDGDIGPPEALTKQQKSDLVAYLKRL